MDNSAPSDSSKNLRIVCTTGIVADLVRNIAGDRATVSSLMSAGVDPHLYKPTRNDVQALKQADLVFYNGLHLEGRMTDVFASLEKSGRRVYAVADKLGDKVLTDEAGHFSDPHVWMDVSLWKECARRVAERLSEADPTGEEMYSQRLTKHLAELDQLDEYVRQVITSIPERRRILITAHDAFRYFSRAYGLEVRSVQGITTDSEAGVNDVNALVELIVAREIPTVFVETSVNPKSLQAVLEGVRSRKAVCQQGPELYSDALGEEGTYEGTFIGMIDANATRITLALDGTAPKKGLHGKLPDPK